MREEPVISRAWIKAAFVLYPLRSSTSCSIRR